MEAQVIRSLLVGCAIAFSGIGGYLAGGDMQNELWRRKLRKRAVAAQAGPVRRFAVAGTWSSVLGYVEMMSRRLSFGVTTRLFPGAFFRKWFDGHILKTGLEGAISFEAFHESSMRLGLVGLGVGLACGSLFSVELMLMGGACAAAMGFSLPRLALARQIEQRAKDLERELPELLEVVALGMRSGLSFDRSFALYPQHFHTAFSEECARVQSSWNLGLTTRDAALRTFASTFDSATFARVVEVVIRALKFGSSLGGELEQASEEARSARRSSKEEEAAKAPVKMMVPTGVLILPAMLLMVLGPVLLEMMNGF